MERYLAAVWNSGATPVLVLNKIDLAAERESLLEAIGEATNGVAVVYASAKSGEGLDALRAYVEPGTTVGFVGSSGVGKSSLMNCLLGREAQAVGGVRSDERGRHTTTARQLILLPGGGVLIDTPGMRELGLLDDAGGIETSFTDVLAFAERCKFRDCAHAGEPGCAVAAAVERGELPAERFAGYRKLLAEVAAADRNRDPILAGRSKARRGNGPHCAPAPSSTRS